MAKRSFTFASEIQRKSIMDELKSLLYGGKEPEGDEALPKVRYEDIPEERRNKWRKHLATFAGVVESDEEFEEWLAVYLHFMSGGCVVTTEEGVREFTPEEEEESRRDQAAYHRAEYNHIKEFNKWRVDHLDPEIEKLADMAAHAPQYCWQNLYALERQKLVCMRTYFSHSWRADKDGHFDGEMWLDICLNLLHHIEEDGRSIPYEQIKKMNIRNVRGLVDQREIDNYLNVPKPTLGKEFYGRKFYVRKMERLYHTIRLYKTRDWWE